MPEQAGGWVRVHPVDALPEGRAVRVWAGGVRLVVGRLPGGGDCFASLDRCPHLDLPLAAFGAVELRDGRLICPWHRWEFDVRTGRCEYASLYADDEIFSFQLEGRDRPPAERRPVGCAASQRGYAMARSRCGSPRMAISTRAGTPAASASLPQGAEVYFAASTRLAICSSCARHSFTPISLACARATGRSSRC